MLYLLPTLKDLPEVWWRFMWYTTELAILAIEDNYTYDQAVSEPIAFEEKHQHQSRWVVKRANASGALGLIPATVSFPISYLMILKHVRDIPEITPLCNCNFVTVQSWSETSETFSRLGFSSSVIRTTRVKPATSDSMRLSLLNILVRDGFLLNPGCWPKQALQRLLFLKISGEPWSTGDAGEPTRWSGTQTRDNGCAHLGIGKYTLPHSQSRRIVCLVITPH
jgi:hypothetical protein